MNNLWKGISLFAIWGGLAAIVIVGEITKTKANFEEYAVAAVIATAFIV